MTQEQHDIDLTSNVTKFTLSANAIALSLSLVAVSGFNGRSDIFAFTKLPLWLFFAGMISSGIYAVTQSLLLNITKNMTEIGLEMEKGKEILLLGDDIAASLSHKLDGSVEVINNRLTTRYRAILADFKKRLDKSDRFIQLFTPKRVGFLNWIVIISFVLNYVFLFSGTCFIIRSITIPSISP